MYSNCYCLRALSYCILTFACLASSCLLIRIDCYIFDFSACLSLRIWRILERFCWDTICSYCIFSIFSWIFSLLRCLSLITSPARFFVSSIFFQVFISSCLRRAIRLASNWASLSTLRKKRVHLQNENGSIQITVSRIIESVTNNWWITFFKQTDNFYLLLTFSLGYQSRLSSSWSRLWLAVALRTKVIRCSSLLTRVIAHLLLVFWR